MCSRPPRSNHKNKQTNHKLHAKKQGEQNMIRRKERIKNILHKYLEEHKQIDLGELAEKIENYIKKTHVLIKERPYKIKEQHGW